MNWGWFTSSGVEWMIVFAILAVGLGIILAMAMKKSRTKSLFTQPTKVPTV